MKLLSYEKKETGYVLVIQFHERSKFHPKEKITQVIEYPFIREKNRIRKPGGEIIFEEFIPQGSFLGQTKNYGQIKLENIVRFMPVMEPVKSRMSSHWASLFRRGEETIRMAYTDQSIPLGFNPEKPITVYYNKQYVWNGKDWIPNLVYGAESQKKKSDNISVEDMFIKDEIGHAKSTGEINHILHKNTIDFRREHKKKVYNVVPFPTALGGASKVRNATSPYSRIVHQLSWEENRKLDRNIKKVFKKEEREEKREDKLAIKEFEKVLSGDFEI